MRGLRAGHPDRRAGAGPHDRRTTGPVGARSGAAAPGHRRQRHADRPGERGVGQAPGQLHRPISADTALDTAIQRFWDGDQGGPQDFAAGDTTVGHVVATYRGLAGAEVVGQVRDVVGSRCRTYVARSGSTWEIDREVPTTWPGVTSFNYCIQVVAPPTRYGYSCTSYAARGNVISRLTVSVTERQPDRTKATTSSLFDDLAARAADRLPAA